MIKLMSACGCCGHIFGRSADGTKTELRCPKCGAEVCAILALWERGNQKTDTNICYSIILFSYASIERNCWCQNKYQMI